MRSRAPLALMEQTVMVLVFALAAAVCLRVFVWSDTRSLRDEARDQAVLYAQSAAEVLKHCRGDVDLASAQLGGSWDGSAWTIVFGKDWNQNSDQPAYLLSVRPEDSGQPYLGQAQVVVENVGGERLFSLTICWQEVSRNG